MKNLFLTLLITAAAPLIGATQELNMVRNGGFEEDSNGDAMADHWQFAGDENATVAWMRDAGFAGQHSQKLTCTDFTSLSPASHVMLCQLNTVRLERNRWYK
ncbi:MAG: hypothetical protein ABIF19_00685, partial [Planctomycetota bacterium]